MVVGMSVRATIAGFNSACFMIGTKILCLSKDLEEVYIPIEDLTEDYIVKIK
jgi:hypothetical protein